MIDKNILLFIEEQKQADNIITIIKSYGINSNINTEYKTDEALKTVGEKNVDILICGNIKGTNDLLKYIHDNDLKTYVIMLANLNELNHVIDLISKRMINHFIIMPYNDEYVREILRQAILHIEEAYKLDYKFNEENEYSEYNDFVNNTKNPVVDAFMSLLKVTGKEIYIHSVQVSKLAVEIAEKMNYPDNNIQTIRIAALLHDIGKISIDNSILNKPGRLDVCETNEMQEHATKSYYILKNLSGFDKIAEIVFQHHERLDGSGYPRGLSGNQILPEARIISVADTYNALVSDRLYRRGMDKKEALNIIKKDIRLYDNQVVNILLGEN